MRSISWESVKKRALNNANNKLNCMHFSEDAGKISFFLISLRLSGDYSPTHEKFKTLRLKIGETILNWDVRGAKTLVSLFPDGFPSWVKNGNFTSDYQDDKWKLVKNNF